MILWCTPRDTFQDAKGWEIPKHHFIHQKRWNSVGRLKKKKNLTGFPPPLLLSFIRLIFPVEFHGKSLVAATIGLSGAAQPRGAKARGKSQGMRSRICPGQAPSLSEPVPRLPPRGSKMPFPKYSLLLQPLLTLHFQGKKGNKIGNRGENSCRSRRRGPADRAMYRGATGLCPSLINTNYHPWHSAASPCWKNCSKGGLGIPSLPVVPGAFGEHLHQPEGRGMFVHRYGMAGAAHPKKHLLGTPGDKGDTEHLGGDTEQSDPLGTSWLDPWRAGILPSASKCSSPSKTRRGSRKTPSWNHLWAALTHSRSWRCSLPPEGFYCWTAQSPTSESRHYRSVFTRFIERISCLKKGNLVAWGLVGWLVVMVWTLEFDSKVLKFRVDQ